MQDEAAVAVFLFTDIEGSSRLWEQSPERMHEALARHDEIAAAIVSAHHGRVVKTTGDGIHAAFRDPLDAIEASLALQIALADPAATAGIALRVRCGMHAGVEAKRDNDFYGAAVNRAARIMSAAHGGQVLLSHAVATLVRDRLPDGASLRELGAVRLRDLSQAENVFQLVHSALRLNFPALRSLEATPNNLPQQLTSFIGREHELAELRRQLRHARLLTIVGIGGLGKSRLSLQVASEALDDYPDGVWFVELAALTDARLVPQVVASVLGVKEEAVHLAGLARFVRDRRLLLVLDNCEHLTQACAELARQLLEAGPHVTVLATSRERLGIAGEKVYPLAPFAVPLPQQALGPEGLAQFGSVRLFVERAAAADPHFSIGDDNAAAVAEICHRLDGIPLALELAAARVRAISVQKLAERLTDRFKLLAGGYRTALPRQQTLRALIDWSYDLLAPEERVLFARLSVFAGGFTLEAAENVGAGDAIAEADVLDLLTRLVDKSLVSLEVERDRYRMLETVRQYAGDRFDTPEEKDAVRTRHLNFFLALCEQGAPQLRGSAPARWLAIFDRERENALVAHAWCDQIADGGPLGLRLARALRNYCYIRGLYNLALEMTLEALARPTARARDFLRCRALSDAGQLALRMGRHDDALGYLEESLAIAREIGDDERAAIVLQPIGLAYLARGEPALARKYFAEALERANAQGNKHEILAAMSAMAQLHRTEGDLATAENMARSVVALARDLDHRGNVGFGLLNLAMITIQRGDPEPAHAMLEEIVAINGEIGDARLTQGILEVAAGLAVVKGDLAQAARFYGAAEARADASALRRDPADEAFVSRLVTDAQQALGAKTFEAGVASGRGLEDGDALREVSAWLAPDGTRLPCQPPSL